jgi:hypothetical protein
MPGYVCLTQQDHATTEADDMFRRLGSRNRNDAAPAGHASHLGASHMVLCIALIVTTVLCLPAFHQSAGIDAVDAFDQGVSMPKTHDVGSCPLLVVPFALVIDSACGVRASRRRCAARPHMMLRASAAPSARTRLAMLLGASGSATHARPASFSVLPPASRRKTTTLRRSSWFGTGGSFCVGTRVRLDLGAQASAQVRWNRPAVGLRET